MDEEYIFMGITPETRLFFSGVWMRNTFLWVLHQKQNYSFTGVWMRNTFLWVLHQKQNYSFSGVWMRNTFLWVLHQKQNYSFSGVWMRNTFLWVLHQKQDYSCKKTDLSMQQQRRGNPTFKRNSRGDYLYKYVSINATAEGRLLAFM